MRAAYKIHLISMKIQIVKDMQLHANLPMDNS